MTEIRRLQEKYAEEPQELDTAVYTDIMYLLSIIDVSMAYLVSEWTPGDFCMVCEHKDESPCEQSVEQCQLSAEEYFDKFLQYIALENSEEVEDDDEG